RESFEHRVHVRGIVTLQKPGESLFIKDETAGLYVETTQEGRVVPGERVDVVGFAALGAYTPILQDARFQSAGSGPRPRTLPVTADEAISGNYDSQLVQLEAELLERSADSKQQTLTLQAGQQTFNAVLEGAPRGEESDWSNGSLLQLTGICRVQANRS